jgi:hypothetical protein
LTTRYNAEPPVRSAILGRDTLVSRAWLPWFQVVSDFIQGRLREAALYDPPNLAAGATVTVDVTVTGVNDTHIAGASFSPMTVGGVATPYMRVFANVTAANTVSVSFLNLGPGAIDLDAGTIRLIVETNT